MLAIGLAIAGWGYWALVANQSWRPDLRLLWLLAFRLPAGPVQPACSKRGQLVTFGGFVALSSIVTYFLADTDNIIVGRLWGPETLGFYSGRTS